MCSPLTFSAPILSYATKPNIIKQNKTKQNKHKTFAPVLPHDLRDLCHHSPVPLIAGVTMGRGSMIDSPVSVSISASGSGVGSNLPSSLALALTDAGRRETFLSEIFNRGCQSVSRGFLVRTSVECDCAIVVLEGNGKSSGRVVLPPSLWSLMIEKETGKQGERGRGGTRADRGDDGSLLALPAGSMLCRVLAPITDSFLQCREKMEMASYSFMCRSDNTEKSTEKSRSESKATDRMKRKSMGYTRMSKEVKSCGESFHAILPSSKNKYPIKEEEDGEEEEEKQAATAITAADENDDDDDDDDDDDNLVRRQRNLHHITSSIQRFIAGLVAEAAHCDAVECRAREWDDLVRVEEIALVEAERRQKKREGGRKKKREKMHRSCGKKKGWRSGRHGEEEDEEEALSTPILSRAERRMRIRQEAREITREMLREMEEKDHQDYYHDHKDHAIPPQEGTGDRVRQQGDEETYPQGIGAAARCLRPLRLFPPRRRQQQSGGRRETRKEEEEGRGGGGGGGGGVEEEEEDGEEEEEEEEDVVYLEEAGAGAARRCELQYLREFSQTQLYTAFMERYFWFRSSSSSSSSS